MIAGEPRLQPHGQESQRGCSSGRMWRQLRPHVATVAAACGSSWGYQGGLFFAGRVDVAN
jgi:hypothetical protein